MPWRARNLVTSRPALAVAGLLALAGPALAQSWYPQSGYGYPAAYPQSGYGYPAAYPQSGYGYPAAYPQAGYAYPQSGYAYPGAYAQGGYVYPTAYWPHCPAPYPQPYPVPYPQQCPAPYAYPPPIIPPQTPPTLPSPAPGTPTTPETPSTPTPETPTTPTPETPTPSAETAAPAPAAETPEAASAFAGLTGTSVSLNAPGGYLDSAIPMTQFRLRYDAGFGMNAADRATYFYGAWQELSFHPHGILNKNGTSGGVFFDANAPGPEQLAGTLNYQETSAYLEVAVNKRLSGFVDLPVRFVNFRNILEEPDTERPPSGGFFPEPLSENTQAPDNQTGGLGDIQLGFKYAFVADPCRYLTLQVRSYLPTGDAREGLGTGHVSLEPSLLLYDRPADRLTLQGQVGIWAPIDGGPLAGNIALYGLGVGYDVYRSCKLQVTPVVEVFGWTVINGFESIAPGLGSIPPPVDGTVVPTGHGVENAAADTIVDIKFGTRLYFPHGQDMYLGWGHAVTGDRWYRDLVRVEYRICF